MELSFEKQWYTLMTIMIMGGVNRPTD